MDIYIESFLTLVQNAAKSIKYLTVLLNDLFFMKRSLQILVLPLVFGIFFSNCASDAEKREASRPMSPWVFRSVIDAQPRMVTLALDKDLYAAYRTDSCFPNLKAWG